MDSVYRQKQKRQSTRHRMLLIIIMLVLAALLVFAALELTGVTSVLHKTSTRAAASAGQSTKGEPIGESSALPGTKDTNSSTNASGTQPGDNKNNSNENTDLITPFGNFVSAHSNVPAGAPLSSVCNTTAGATCRIQFTSGSVTKSLTPQVTDRAGATYWSSWTPASIGLSSGSWKVEAVATLNNQTKTSNDPMNLEVQ